MPELSNLLVPLLNNLVFLLIALPVVGAWLVVGISGLGIESIRRTVLTNVVLTNLLALLLVWHYDPELTVETAAGTQSQLTQMITRVRWLSRAELPEDEQALSLARVGPDIRLEVGADGISLWFLAGTCLLMIPVLASVWNRPPRYPALFFAVTLLTQAALLGAFAARDAILFYIGLEFSALLLLILLAGWGGEGKRELLSRYFLSQRIGHLLILAGLSLLVVSNFWLLKLLGKHVPPTFALSDLHLGYFWMLLSGGAEGAERASAYWQDLSLLVPGLLLAGALWQMPAYPFHTWHAAFAQSAPPAARILQIGAGMKLGLYLLVRCVVPFGYSGSATAPGWMQAAFWLCILGTVLTAGLALAQGSLLKQISCLALSVLGLSVAGVLAGSRLALSGAILHAFQHGLTFGVLLLLAQALEDRYRTTDIPAFSGLRRMLPGFTLCYLLASAAVIGLPGSGAAASTLVTWLALYRQHPAAAVTISFSLFLIVWTVCWTVQRIVGGPAREPYFRAISASAPAFSPLRVEAGDTAAPDLELREWLGVLPCLAVLLWLGLAPDFFLSRIEPTLRELNPLALLNTADSGQ